jgi:hypothetical protein
MTTNRERLIALMDRDSLTVKDVAAMVQASPDTVTGWLRPESNAAHRKVSDRVLQILDLALGARIEVDPSRAADALGTTIGKVKELASAATIILDGALYADRKAGDLMRRIEAGEVVELRFGGVRALASSNWAFVPVAHGPKSILLAVPARIRETEVGPILDTTADDWRDARAARQAQAAATRLNELNAEEARLEARIVGTTGKERDGIEAALRANEAARRNLDI